MGTASLTHPHLFTPQGEVQRSSLHAKGEVGDALIAQELGDRPFRQVMGFNADETGRSRRDEAARKNPLRQGVYPLIEWGWGRARCEAFLYERFGVRWEKSYCSFRCFPVSVGAMADHLNRMRAHPDIAGRVLRLEYTSVSHSLNPQTNPPCWPRSTPRCGMWPSVAPGLPACAARERADAYDTGGLLPAQTVQQTGKVLAKARAALDSPMGNLDELARHTLEVDDR